MTASDRFLRDGERGLSLSLSGGVNINSIPKLQWALDGGGYRDDLLDGIPVLTSRESHGTYRSPLPPRCLGFNGTTGYLSRAKLFTVTKTGFTVCGWVKLASTAVMNFAQEGTTTSNQLSWTISFVSGMASIIVTSTGNPFVAAKIIQCPAPTVNEWHHFALVYDGSLAAAEQLKAYIDGVSQTMTYLAGGTTSITTTYVTTGTFNLGRNNDASPSFFSGKMFDFRVYDAAKSDTQVAAIANNHITRTAPDIVNLATGQWLNETLGVVAYNFVSGVTMDHNGGITNEPDSPGWNPANWRGYSDEYGLGVTPRNETTGNDIANQPLPYTGMSPFPIAVQATMPAVSSSSASVFKDYDRTINYPFSIHAKFRATGTEGTIGCVAQSNVANNFTAIYWSSSTLRTNTNTPAGNTVHNSAHTVNDGNWHSVTAVWESETSRKIYVDGNAVETSTATRAFSVTSNMRLSAFRHSDSTPSFGFNGAGNMADWQFHEKALSDSEVEYLHTHGTSGTAPSLPVALPAEFDGWDLDATITTDGLGNYSATFDYDALRPQYSTTFYVDSVNGNNGTADGTVGLPYKTLAAAITAGSGTMRYLLQNGSYTLTANLAANAVFEAVNPGNVTIAGTGLTALGGNTGISVACKGIEFLGRTFLTNGVQVFDNCTVTNSTSGGGFMFRGSAVSYCRDCTATDGDDGFDYVSTCSGIEINCTGTNNAFVAASNGSTCHNDSRVVRVNGTYTGNCRNIHDINDSMSVNFNCIATDCNTSFSPANAAFNIGSGFETVASETCKVWCFGGDYRRGGTSDVYGDTDSNLYFDSRVLYDTASDDADIGVTPSEFASVMWTMQEGSGSVIYSVARPIHGDASLVTWVTPTNAIKDRCVDHGGRLETAVFVPSRLGGLVAANGSALTTTSGKVSPKSEIEPNPFDAPELAGITASAPYASSVDVSDTDTANTKFVRTGASLERDRWIMTETALVNADLTKVENYTT